MEICYGRANRLKEVAISNKHAAIKGPPHIDEDDAAQIAKALLAIKGIAKTRHKYAHAVGELKLLEHPLAYRGSAAEWRKVIQKGEDWENHLAPHVKRLDEEVLLRKV